MIGLDVLVGVGSILWHTYPNDITLIVDVVPIVLFIMWYVWLYARRVMAVGPLFAALFVFLFVSTTYLTLQYASLLHGAPVYTPGLVVVFLVGLYHLATQKPAKLTLIAAAGVYLIALFFRTIDNEVCPVWPLGTHFIWHSLIGFVTYIAARGLILAWRLKDQSV